MSRHMEGFEERVAPTTAPRGACRLRHRLHTHTHTQHPHAPERTSNFQRVHFLEVPKRLKTKNHFFDGIRQSFDCFLDGFLHPPNPTVRPQ